VIFGEYSGIVENDILIVQRFLDVSRFVFLYVRRYDERSAMSIDHRGVDERTIQVPPRRGSTLIRGRLANFAGESNPAPP